MLTSKLCLDEVDVRGKRVLLRADFNVPMKDGTVRDPKRIVATLPTMQYILNNGARSLVLMSHAGRPNGQVQTKFSLRPIVPILEEILGRKVEFLPDCVGSATISACANPRPGTVFLLENLRFHVEEQGKGTIEGKKVKADKKSVEAFREALTKLGDVYVNDAFGTAHRSHSSMVGINLPVRAGGFLIQKELKAFGTALESPRRPFLAILGGAKVRDKIQLIDNLLDKVDVMIIGGGMAHTFRKVIEGINIGSSLFDQKGAELVPRLMRKAQEKGVKIHLPVDYKIASKFSVDAQVDYTTGDVRDGWMALDCGPLTCANNAQVIWNAKTIVMNGPQGVFEFPAFTGGTQTCLQAMVAATQLRGATTILGGGDTAASAKQFGLVKLVTHSSTGGGASLELLEGKTLPGIAALSNKKLQSSL